MHSVTGLNNGPFHLIPLNVRSLTWETLVHATDFYMTVDNINSTIDHVDEEKDLCVIVDKQLNFQSY